MAVHPEDERYQKFIGRKVIVPMLGREIPVIADEYVTREFGTGALKITPGHDPNDYEIGQRHGLPVLSMLDREAKVTEIGGPYAGLDRFECREKLWADMQAAGLVIKEEAYTLNVPRSQRGGEIVEPMISEQWFVKIEPLAEAGLKQPCGMGASASSRSTSRRSITTGWKTSRIGASAASCGGDTASRSGTATTAANRPAHAQTRPNAPIAARRISTRTRTCWTPGSPPACGRSPRWAGPKRHPITNISTRPA